MAKLQMLKPSMKMAGQRIQVMQQTRNPEADQRIRGRRWMAIRARWFSDHPLCVECLAAGKARAATQLDHKVPLIDGGKDDETNLQGLCFDHHQAKTAAEAKARGRA